MQLNWADWFLNHASNDAGNSNLQAFSDSLGEGFSNAAKLRDLVDEIDTVILATDSNRNVILFHSPKNFGGTRSCPENKVSCLIGLGDRATTILIDLNSAFRDLRFVVPSVQDLADCESAKDVTNLNQPDENGVIRFEGPAIFIPGPVLRNAIIALNSRNPFKLNPIVSQAARAFDQEHADAGAVRHAHRYCDGNKVFCQP